jgi:hypothetical protein
VSAAHQLDGTDDPDVGPRGWPFWTGLVLGWALIAFGVRQVLVDADATNPPGLARWVLGGLIVHDLLLAPIATAIAVALARPRWRWWAGPATTALALSAIVVAFAYPMLRGYGIRSANPSALPRDYRAAILVILVGVWAIGAAVVAWRAMRRTSRP